MATAAPTRPPDLRRWDAPDDDAPRPPEAPWPRWPLQAGPLDSAQARRALRDLDNRKQ